MSALKSLSCHPTLKMAKAGRDITMIPFNQMYEVPLRRGDFAVPAFNVRNFPLPANGGFGEGYIGPSTVTQILKAARDLEAPVVIEIAHSELGEEGSPYTGVVTRHGLTKGTQLFVDHIFTEYQKLNMAGIPIGIHYDHGTDMDIVKAAIHAGFTSVAMDGGDQPDWESLVGKAKSWVDYCHPLGVGVEGEIELVDQEKPTDPYEAIEFAKATGVDVLVITLAKNVHGAKPGSSVMDTERLEAVRKGLPDMPVNLHGGSGFSLDVLQKTAQAGLFQKLNYATEVFEAMIKAVPGWQAILNMISGQEQGTRPKAGRKKLAQTDFLLPHITPEFVRAAESAAYEKILATMVTVGNIRTAKYYTV